MPLTDLPALLVDEPGLTAVLGRRDAVLAVPAMPAVSRVFCSTWVL